LNRQVHSKAEDRAALEVLQEAGVEAVRAEDLVQEASAAAVAHRAACSAEAQGGSTA